MEFFARLRLVWEPVSGGPLFNHTSAKLDLWAQFFTSYIMPATLPNDYSPDYLCASSVALSHWYQLHLLVHNATHAHLNRLNHITKKLSITESIVLNNSCWVYDKIYNLKRWIYMHLFFRKNPSGKPSIRGNPPSGVPGNPLASLAQLSLAQNHIGTLNNE